MLPGTGSSFPYISLYDGKVASSEALYDRRGHLSKKVYVMCKRGPKPHLKCYLDVDDFY